MKDHDDYTPTAIKAAEKRGRSDRNAGRSIESPPYKKPLYVATWRRAWRDEDERLAMEVKP